MGSVCGSACQERKSRGRAHDALAEDRQEPRVEPAEALLAREAREARHEPVRVPVLRYEPDARCLERREEDICEESVRVRRASVRGVRCVQGRDALGDGRSAEVDRGAVAHRGLLVARDLRELLLPELVAGELGAALRGAFV